METVTDDALQKPPAESGETSAASRGLPAWVRLIREGKLDAARELLEDHLRKQQRDANALEDLGVVFARQRRFEEAAANFKESLDIAPRRAGTWRNLGRAYADLGRLAEAEPCLLKVVELEPNLSANQKALAELYTRLTRADAALVAIERAVALEPESADLHNELGRTLANTQRYADAKKEYVRAIELNSESSEFHNNLGVACQELGEHEEAIGHFKEAIRLRPGVVGVYNNLGVALNEQRRFEEAIECYNKALAIGPDYALAWNNLGNSLRAIGRNEAAVAALETAIRLKPDYPEAFNNIAIAYVQMGENEKALAWYDKALCFRPDYPECHMNRALQRLLVGDLANGWADYEWRWHLKTMRYRDLKRPLWDGSPLGGKRILIYWEQGLGDSIQFIRYASELKDRGATVIFEGQPPLQHLLSRTPGIDQFIPRGSELPPFDVHAPLLSLPGQCHTTLENVPANIPYIFPDPHFVNLWKPRLNALKGLRVGIVWQGNPDHRGDHLRSFPLRLFEPLAKMEGVTLVSLQKNHGCDQIAQLEGRFNLTCFDGIDEEVDGFLRTAAIMKNLDLVIAADTSVAHLAGAMGIPVWVMIAVASDWRWLRNREDSPWYPTARLFRQKEPGNWIEVFERVAAALAERVKASPRRMAQITADDRRKAKQTVRNAAKHLVDNELTKAQELLEQAVQIDSESVDAHHDLGVVYGRQKRVQQAIASFRRALELQPNSASAYGNIGLAFLQNGQTDEAIAHLRSAIRQGGGSADVYNNLGVALMKSPDAAAAEAFYVKALHLRPDFAAAHCNLARALLIQGKFQQGWLELEWRWKHAEKTLRREFHQPRWTGQALHGRTLLLWVEAGASAGEVLQFIRYAPFLKQRAGRVIVECPKRLVSLILRCVGVDVVFATGSSAPHFDFHAPVLSLPAIVGTTLHTIPIPVPYVSLDQARTQAWTHRIDQMEGLKVGIAWDSDSDFDSNNEGAIPLEHFRRLSQLAGVRLVSLQRGSARKQLAKVAGRMVPVDLGAELDEDPDNVLLDLAAIMSRLDLVVTADATIAHLAGALGIPVWIALAASPHFRWLLERQDSPWYPSLRIFRQKGNAGWAELFERIADALVERVAESIPAAGKTQSTDLTARTLHDEACRHFARGEFSEACERFEQTLRFKPDLAAAHHDLAVALAKLRKFDSAVEHFRRAVELEPSSKAYGNLALALLERGDFVKAAGEIRTILQAAPDSAEINCRLGIALARMGQHSEAIAYLLKATELHLQSAEAHYWLGEARRNQKVFDAAIESFRQTIQLRPEWHEAHNCLGLCFASQGKHEQAIEAFRKTVQLKRDFAEAWNKLAISLADSNLLPDATDAFQHALYLNPDNAETHRNLAITLLLQGKYEQGWLEYEWRLRAKDSQRRGLPGHRWDGTSLKNKSLLMTVEQGIGDTIQFVRYAKLAKEQGTRTIVECQAPLVSLLKRCPFIDQVVSVGDPLPNADFHAALMSLPVGFRTANEAIPAPIPYLFTDKALVERWGERLHSDQKLKIGIVWQGNRGYGGDRHRSIPLAEFAPLSRIPGIELISLQKGWGVEQIDSATFAIRQLALFEDATTTFDDTAAIVSQLDAIVTCDTSVGHLAGALGVPVFLALSTANDWRWMRGRKDTPWYPNTTLFRQERLGEWGPVFNAIADEATKIAPKTGNGPI